MALISNIHCSVNYDLISRHYETLIDSVCGIWRQIFARLICSRSSQSHCTSQRMPLFIPSLETFIPDLFNMGANLTQTPFTQSMWKSSEVVLEIQYEEDRTLLSLGNVHLSSSFAATTVGWRPLQRIFFFIIWATF